MRGMRSQAQSDETTSKRDKTARLRATRKQERDQRQEGKTDETPENETAG